MHQFSRVLCKPKNGPVTSLSTIYKQSTRSFHVEQATGFPLGNYPDYYKFRRKEDGTDERLDYIKPQWFKSKRVLDIGCNSGWLTIEIAYKYKCKHAVGVDIDRLLISRAKDLLKERTSSTFTPYRPPASTTLTPPSSSSSAPSSSAPSSSPTDPSSSSSSTPSTPQDTPTSPEPDNTAPKDTNPTIEFFAEDFVTSKNHPEPYDTITCFSVVKWIHLNKGDQGLLAFFEKVKTHLVDGGIFILEPQNWGSYANRRDVSPTTEKNLRYIKIKPDKFISVLERSYDMQLLHQYKIFSHRNDSFNREILVFQKLKKKKK